MDPRNVARRTSPVFIATVFAERFSRTSNHDPQNYTVVDTEPTKNVCACGERVLANLDNDWPSGKEIIRGCALMRHADEFLLIDYY